MAKQRELALAWDRRDEFRRQGHELRVACIEVAHRAEKQGLVLASDLGVDPGQFSRALYGRGTYLDVAWLSAFIAADSERLVLGKAASFIGCEVQPRRDLSPEEQRDRLVHELRNSGAAGEAILKRALGDDAP